MSSTVESQQIKERMKQLFTTSQSYWMHIDLNSCFATIEQQANPLLRNKPIAIAAYATERGCILAPSIEAKRFGIKTGMRVKEGKQLCPHLIVMASDPAKYRFVNKQFTTLFQEYSPQVSVRSIDEMLLNFKGLPLLKSKTLPEVGKEIKFRIRKEIGEWLTVSIGIAPNPYLAKLAAGIHKPDGLDEINAKTIVPILTQLQLVDLPYIKERNALRLNRYNIWKPLDFYQASPTTLRHAFQSVVGEYWYLRLHGYPVDETEWQQKTIGHSYHLIKFTADVKKLKQMLCKLVEKMGRRIRRHNYTAAGMQLALLYADGSYWHESHTFPYRMYTSKDLYTAACFLLEKAPKKLVRILAVSSFSLEENLYSQLSMFTDEQKKRSLSQALDRINDTWGEFTVVPANMLGMENIIVDRIAFGKAN